MTTLDQLRRRVNRLAQTKQDPPGRVIIYDPAAGPPERPAGYQGVIFYIPDNGRDRPPEGVTYGNT